MAILESLADADLKRLRMESVKQENMKSINIRDLPVGAIIRVFTKSGACYLIELIGGSGFYYVRFDEQGEPSPKYRGYAIFAMGIVILEKGSPLFYDRANDRGSISPRISTRAKRIDVLKYMPAQAAAA